MCHTPAKIWGRGRLVSDFSDNTAYPAFSWSMAIIVARVIANSDMVLNISDPYTKKFTCEVPPANLIFSFSI